MAKRQKKKNVTKKKGGVAKKTDTALISERPNQQSVGASAKVARAIGRILVTILQTLLVGLPFVMLALCAILFAIAKISLPPLVEAMSSFDVATMIRVIYEEVSKGWLLVGLTWLGLGLGLMIVFVVQKIKFYERQV